MIKKMFEAFKKLEMSKKLAVTVTVFWLIVMTANIIIFEITGNTINAIADYVQSAFLIVLSGYFGKAAIENVTKIKNSNNDVDFRG